MTSTVAEIPTAAPTAPARRTRPSTQYWDFREARWTASVESAADSVPAPRRGD
jgi:hypothetical protein